MKAHPTKMSTSSRILIILAGISLTISIFLPIWRIDLDAPQYPEGLRLFIFSNKLGGDVEIINGLNHYIGMKTLHAEEFIEFTVLPYIIGVYALLSLVVAGIGNKKMQTLLFALFVIFGIVAMVDFWRWEYDYGHNLDPHAAIIVPGMAYQPPLIGFKQLLNFGAYSIPAIGGWLFVSAGVLMLISLLIERNLLKKASKMSITVTLFLPLLLASCSKAQPEAVKLNQDACDYCKMTISDRRFAAELITEKGRVYKFDDVDCMNNYVNENPKSNGSELFIADHSEAGKWIPVEKAFYIVGEDLGSPMGGNTAAYSVKDSAIVNARRFNSQETTWEQIIKK